MILTCCNNKTINTTFIVLFIISFKAIFISPSFTCGQWCNFLPQIRVTEEKQLFPGLSKPGRGHSLVTLPTLLVTNWSVLVETRALITASSHTKIKAAGSLDH